MASDTKDRTTKADSLIGKLDEKETKGYEIPV